MVDDKHNIIQTMIIVYEYTDAKNLPNISLNNTILFIYTFDSLL